MIRTFFFVIALFPGMALADMVVASRTIRAHQVITERDVKLSSGTLAMGFERILDVVGQEARIALYAGRPIEVDAIGPPAIVARNQIVLLSFSGNGVEISTDGRALERGAVGDRVRVMNLSSRMTVFGQIEPDGTIKVMN